MAKAFSKSRERFLRDVCDWIFWNLLVNVVIQVLLTNGLLPGEKIIGKQRKGSHLIFYTLNCLNARGRRKYIEELIGWEILAENPQKTLQFTRTNVCKNLMGVVE